MWEVDLLTFQGKLLLALPLELVALPAWGWCWLGSAAMEQLFPLQASCDPFFAGNGPSEGERVAQAGVSGALEVSTGLDGMGWEGPGSQIHLFSFLSCTAPDPT